MAGAVANPFARLGKGCIVNTCVAVDHDCVVADYVHVAVGSHLCGTVSVGAHTWIGAGAVVSNNVSVCADCMIGAGAVVIKDVVEAGTYVGVPAGKITYSLKMSEIEEDIQNWENLKKRIMRNKLESTLGGGLFSMGEILCLMMTILLIWLYIERGRVYNYEYR